MGFFGIRWLQPKLITALMTLAWISIPLVRKAVAWVRKQVGVQSTRPPAAVK